jgi:hypothetical protein
MGKHFSIRRIAFSSSYILIPLTFSAYITVKFQQNDFMQLTGDKWTGILTYVDYSNGKRVSIKADVSVEYAGKNTWYFRNEYPDEPHANSIDTIVVYDESRINAEMIQERTALTDGTVKIITVETTADTLPSKTFRYTYLLSREKFSIRKEESEVGHKNYKERNIFEYLRKARGSR